MEQIPLYTNTFDSQFVFFQLFGLLGTFILIILLIPAITRLTENILGSASSFSFAKFREAVTLPLQSDYLSRTNLYDRNY